MRQAASMVRDRRQELRCTQEKLPNTATPHRSGMQWHVPPVPVEALRVVLLQQLKDGEQRLDIQVTGAQACGSTHIHTQRRRKRGEERATRHKHTLRVDRDCIPPTNPAVPPAELHIPTAGPLPQPKGRNGCLTRRYRLIAGSHTADAAHLPGQTGSRSGRLDWPPGLQWHRRCPAHMQ